MAKFVKILKWIFALGGWIYLLIDWIMGHPPPIPPH